MAKRRKKPRTKVDTTLTYDFSEGVRGKYAGRYAEGSNVVVLAPDLAEAFPTSEVVTDALRGLVSLARKTTTGHSETNG